LGCSPTPPCSVSIHLGHEFVFPLVSALKSASALDLILTVYSARLTGVSLMVCPSYALAMQYCFLRLVCRVVGCVECALPSRFGYYKVAVNWPAGCIFVSSLF